MSNVLEIAERFLPMLATIAIVVCSLAAINWFLKRRWQDKPDAQFHFQLIMLALTFAGVLTIIVALPIEGSMRGQLLSLIGILLSAAIALSSTTFIGNIMAGIMLKVVKNARPGDFITVAHLTGRITEMDLLHTEIQTEFRDLVTVPNLYMVTQPLRVVRASGTIITSEVSLGYDVPRGRVTELLCNAATQSGLKESFVHVRELGDFSVTYRVAGLLEDVRSLISSRARLRESMLDALHAAGIEIVSPTFMNTRALSKDQQFIPKRPRKRTTAAQTPAEEIAFDKADEAASVEQIRIKIEQIDAVINDEKIAADDDARAVLEARKSALVELHRIAEEEKKTKDLAE